MVYVVRMQRTRQRVVGEKGGVVGTLGSKQQVVVSVDEMSLDLSYRK